MFHFIDHSDSTHIEENNRLHQISFCQTN